jgi:hypothetical protein
VSPAGLFGIDNAERGLPAVEERTAGPIPNFDSRERTTELVIGERKLRTCIPAIRELHLRCGQQEDLTTDPQYFIAANTQKDRRVAAVLIRRNHELEACVFFIEHCRLGMGLGFLRGGGHIGESLVVGPGTFQLQYVRLATEVLLQHWRIHGVSLAIAAPLSHCLEVMGPEDRYRVFSGRDIQRKLPLEDSYKAMLAAMGPRTRRSLAGKRRKLEQCAHVAFLSSLEPVQALEAMLRLHSRSLPPQLRQFCHARYSLLHERPEFFSMGMRLPNGTWLSILSGWRRNRVTYVDLQMNNMHFKKESLSAVMRAFMLEHEIAREQKLIHFVGGTSVLLRRYCRPNEPCTELFLSRPCLRATFFRIIVPLMKPKSIYERVREGTRYQRNGLDPEDLM